VQKSKGDPPFEIGDRVYHYGQQWAARIPGGTATVLEIKGPYHDGSYELLVSTGEEFSRRTGPDNPETRSTWWPSRGTRHAQMEGTA